MTNMFNESLRHEYDLNKDSIVFDIGGYKGEWSKIMFDKYGCKIYCFEPVFGIINSDIKIFNYGLGAKNEALTIKVDTDKTGKFCKSGEECHIEVRDIIGVLREFGIKNCDLMKINIEGMEYELLDRLISTGWIKKIDNLQIQFHRITPTSDRDMYLIQYDLKKTHTPTWQYRYVWENWKRK